MEEPLPYCAYLIRLWPTQRGGVPGYRVSAECVRTGERSELPDLESLVTFLRAEGGEERKDRDSGLDSGRQGIGARRR